MGLPFLQPMDIDPSGPSGQALQVLFLSSSVAPFTPFGPLLIARGANWGDGQINTSWRIDVHRLMAEISAWTVTSLIGMTVEMPSKRWHSQWDDGWKDKSSGIQSFDKLSRSIYGARHVLLFGWFLSRIEASLRLPCTSPIKITLLSLISLLFAENILSERARHPCQRSVHSTPASFDLIRSLFSSISNFFHSICFFFHLSFPLF